MLALAGLLVAGAAYSPPSDPREEMTLHELSRLVDEGEIVFRHDGSVIAYEAPLGQPARPRIVRPAIRPLLQAWSPFLASASLAIVALVVIKRRPTSHWGRHDEDDIEINEEEAVLRSDTPASIRPHAQLTLGWVMLGIVLIALNLTAAHAVSRYYPRSTPPFTPLQVRYGNGRGLALYRPNGSILLMKDVKIGYQLTHRVWPIPSPTTLQIWSPLIASLAISVLVLALMSRPRGRWPVFIRLTGMEQ